MPFDGIVTAAVAQQLSEVLTGGKIEKIYQPEPDELLIHINSKKERFKLYLSAGSTSPRLNLVKEYGSNPSTPLGFCMLLRKHIQGGRIHFIEQRDSERILEISINTINELGFSQNKKLIVEIMGKHSNILLIDDVSNKIIDSIKRISFDVNRYRQSLPGLDYIYPPSQNKSSCFSISYEKMEELMSGSTDSENESDFVSSQLVSNIQGISPRLAQSLSYEASFLNGELAQNVFQVFSNMISNMRLGVFSPRIYLDSENRPIDFHVFPLSEFENNLKVVIKDNVSEAIEYFYTNREASNRIRQKSTDLLKAIQTNMDKLYLKKQRLSEDILKAEKAHIYRLYGELLTANIHNLKGESNSAKLLNYYNDEEILIPLDSKYTAAQNAQLYYKKYNKSKIAIVEKNAQLENADGDIEYLESLLAHIENATTVEIIDSIREELIESGYLKRRKQKAKAIKKKNDLLSFTTKNGGQILVGRNNIENDLITFKKSSPKDLWFHTKDIPGSHVVLSSKDNHSPLDDDIVTAAKIAAYHSKAKNSENVPVDYTLVKYVKKPAKAKPGMVFFTNNKTLFVTPEITI